MLLVEILAFKLAEVGKHGAVLHVVTVDHAVIGQSQLAILLHIGDAVLTVRFVKSMLQIKVLVAGGLHDRIVDLGVLNADPADKIAILLIDRRILVIGRQLRGRLIACRGVCSVLAGGVLHGGKHRRRGRLYKIGHGVERLGALFGVLILANGHHAGENKKGGEQHRPDQKENLCLIEFTHFHYLQIHPRRVLSSSVYKAPYPWGNG